MKSRQPIHCVQTRRRTARYASELHLREGTSPREYRLSGVCRTHDELNSRIVKWKANVRTQHFYAPRQAGFRIIDDFASDRQNLPMRAAAILPSGVSAGKHRFGCRHAGLASIVSSGIGYPWPRTRYASPMVDLRTGASFDAGAQLPPVSQRRACMLHLVGGPLVRSPTHSAHPSAATARFARCSACVAEISSIQFLRPSGRISRRLLRVTAT